MGIPGRRARSARSDAVDLAVEDVEPNGGSDERAQQSEDLTVTAEPAIEQAPGPDRGQDNHRELNPQM
jgi:hypothetical protein